MRFIGWGPWIRSGRILSELTLVGIEVKLGSLAFHA